MFDRSMRRVKHRLTGTPAIWLGRYVGPLPLTLLALVIGLGAAAAAALGSITAALLLWLLNRFVDGLDGEVARARGEASDFGAYVDMMSDVVIYAVIPLAVAYYHQDIAVTGALLLMMAAFYANITSWSYLAALIEKRHAAEDLVPDDRQTSVVMPRALIEGTETIVVYGLLLGVPVLVREVAVVAAAAGLISTIQRVFWAIRTIRD